MRCFIAIEVPRFDDIVAVQQDLPKLGRVNLTKSFHLTLKFIGEINNPEQLINKLSRIRFNTFELETTHIGYFPNKNHPRVVWLGLTYPDELKRLYSEIIKTCGKDKVFVPHVTLGRVKRLENKVELDNKLLKHKFRVSEFILYKSTLTPNGPIYEAMKVFPSE